jgi:hypothetical protein
MATDVGFVVITVTQAAAQLQVSQVVVEASNYDVATGVQLQVSQLAAEASSFFPTPLVRASQVVVEAIDADVLPTIRASQLVVEAIDKEAPVVITPAPRSLRFVGNQLPQEYRVAGAILALAGNLSPGLFVTLPLWPQPASLLFRGNRQPGLTTYQWAIPVSDIAVGAFVPSTGIDLFACINEYEEPNDATFIEAVVATEATLQMSALNPEETGDTAEMIIRLKREI